MSVWPDFFIVGAPRSGTSSLYELLSRSDEICMSKVKEPRFFSSAIDHSAFMSGSVTDEAAYLALFSHCASGTTRGEASPNYLTDPGTPELIAAKVPNAKIIAILRDPVTRAYSHYMFHEVRTGRTDRTFREAIEECRQLLDTEMYHPRYLLHPGFYTRQLGRYIDTFGAGYVLILLHDDFVKDTAGEVTKVCDFLGVAVPDDLVLAQSDRNAAGSPRSTAARILMKNKPLRWIVSKLGLGARAVEVGKKYLLKPADKVEMNAADRNLLVSIYAEDVAALEQLIGRQVPWPIARGGTPGR